LNRPKNFSGKPRAGERNGQAMALTAFLAYTGRLGSGRSGHTRFPVKTDGFGGTEMNQRVPAPSAVRTPVPLLRTLSPAAKDRGAAQAKVQADIVVSMANVPGRTG
jgi:hypothetical protein